MIAAMTLGCLLATQTIGRVPKTKAVADVALMPISVEAEVKVDDREKFAQWARGSVLLIFRERNFDTTSPIIIESTGRRLEVDYADEAIWGKDSFSKFALFARNRFVCAVKVLSVETEERAPPDPRAPGMTLVTVAKVRVWLYDDKAVKLTVDGVEAVGELTVGRPGPSRDQTQTQAAQAVGKAVRVALATALKKFPVVKKKP